MIMLLKALRITTVKYVLLAAENSEARAEKEYQSWLFYVQNFKITLQQIQQTQAF